MAGEGVSSKLAFMTCTMHGWVNGLCARVRSVSLGVASPFVAFKRDQRRPPIDIL